MSVYRMIRHPWNDGYYAVLVGDGGEIEAADGPLTKDFALQIAGDEEAMRAEIMYDWSDSRELGDTLQFQLRRYDVGIEDIVVRPPPGEE